MKKFLAIIFLSLGIFTACGSNSKEDVYDGIFVSEEGKFSVNFPGEPEVLTKPISFKDSGDVKMQSFYYEQGSVAMILAYSDVPGEKIDEKTGRILLKEEQLGALSSFGIDKPEVEKENDYKGSIGLNYKAKIDGKLYIVAQTYLVGNRLYQIQMFFKENYPSEEEEKAFIGSFKLLE